MAACISGDVDSTEHSKFLPVRQHDIDTVCSEHTTRHTHLFNGPFSGTTQVSRYQKGKTNPDFTEARDREWQWHQLGHVQVCTLLQTDNHTSTPPLCFLQAGCPSCRPTNSVKALKAINTHNTQQDTETLSPMSQQFRPSALLTVSVSGLFR